MGRSSHQRDKNGNSSTSNDGTSARTRPVNFDEIMLRRKSKGEPKEFDNIVGAHSVSAKEDNSKWMSDCLEPDQYRHNESLPSDFKHTLEDSLKLRARQTEDNKMADKLARDKKKERRESEIKSKTSMNKDVSDKRLDDSRTRKDGLVKRRKDNDFIDDSGNGTGKRRSRDFSRKERSIDKTSGRHHEERKDKYPDKDERQSYRKRKDTEMASDAVQNESEKRHSRNYGQRESYGDRTKEKSEPDRRKQRNDDEERNRDKNAAIKHNSGKVSEFSGRKESSRVHLEEQRPRRRRSRSPEYDKDRDRRSRSGSPRTRKHSSQDMREHGDLSSHSSKDKSGKSHSDLDKKISSNGTVSNPKHHAGFTSGLGGYSPRKRKTVAAAKTPSPTNRSPDRKSAGWDLTPASLGSNITGSSPTLKSSIQSVIPNTHQLPSAVPASPFPTNASGVSYNYLSSSIHAIDSIQLTQATRPMRRLYVENLPSSTSEKDILDWINNFLLSSGVSRIQGTQPCISCMIHKEKGQALLEFLTPEDASAALSFDGRSFSGSNLRIRRPKDFVQVATGVPQSLVAVAERIDDTVADSSYKIFIGGISKTISSEMLMEIVKAFGTLKGYHFRMNSDLNEPCAFLEYVDHSVTLKACAGLNGMKLGGKVLTVVQAVLDTTLLEKVENEPFYGIPHHAKPLLEKPTEVLKLKNVMDAKELLFLSEAELEELLEDIRLECARFGTVKSINVVKDCQCSLTSDTAVMIEASPTVDEKNMEFAKESDRDDSISSRISDHELQEVGRSQLPNNDEDPMVTISAVEVKICPDGKPHISEPSKGDSEKVGDVDDAFVAGGHCNDRPSEDLIKDDTPDTLPDDIEVSAQDTNCQENSEVTPGFSPNEKNAAISELERNDENDNSSPSEHLQINDESPGNEAMKSEEDNGNIDGASEPELLIKKELDVPEENEKNREISNNWEVFEPGCVLVEFRRAETSCMAAHCLHGRLFNDRIVTVEYVSLDLYRMKFSNQF